MRIRHYSPNELQSQDSIKLCNSYMLAYAFNNESPQEPNQLELITQEFSQRNFKERLQGYTEIKKQLSESISTQACHHIKFFTDMLEDYKNHILD